MPRRQGSWDSWGKQPNDSMAHRYDKDKCHHCNFSGEYGLYHYAVGFSNKPEYRKPEYRGTEFVEYLAEGALVIECPQCFELSWAHIGRSSFVVEDEVIDDPAFLRVPGATEAFLKMLERRDHEESVLKGGEHGETEES